MIMSRFKKYLSEEIDPKVFNKTIVTKMDSKTRQEIQDNIKWLQDKISVEQGKKNPDSLKIQHFNQRISDLRRKLGG